jgi:hypothetical protein
VGVSLGLMGRVSGFSGFSVTPIPDLVRTPLIQKEGINHKEHSDHGKDEARDLADPVTKVE